MGCCTDKRRGGKREQAGRKKTCLKKVPFTRRLNENVLNILKAYALEHNMTDTEALECAVLMQTNLYKLRGDKIMKIAIPSSEGKLCAHFGHCDSFAFAEVNPETKEILSIEERVPSEGISCHSAAWIAQEGASVVLAGGMGMRPMMMFEENGVKVIPGCPELPLKEIVQGYLNGSIQAGENSCGGGHHNCHGHENGHSCHH